MVRPDDSRWGAAPTTRPGDLVPPPSLTGKRERTAKKSRAAAKVDERSAAPAQAPAPPTATPAKAAPHRPTTPRPTPPKPADGPSRSAPHAAGPPRGTRPENATTWLKFFAPKDAVEPVFVDGTGRRKLFWRVVGVLVALLCVAFVVLIIVAAVSGSPINPTQDAPSIRSLPASTVGGVPLALPP